MRALLLSRVDKDSTNTCYLPIGEHVIGRGALLQCTSKKVSRNHAIIRVPEEEAVTLTAIHHNPCFYLSKETKHITVLKNGTSIQLHDQDQIALLSDEYWYKIEIENANDSKNIDNKNGCIKGKKRENLENSSNEDNTSKRLKSDNCNLEENNENLVEAGHSTTINNSSFEISLNLQSNEVENLPPVSSSDLNNIDNQNSSSRSESPDFLNSVFNVLDNEHIQNISEGNNYSDYIVTKGDVPERSNENLKERNDIIYPPEKNNIQGFTLDDLNNHLLETLSDLHRNNEDSNSKEENKTTVTTTENLVQTDNDISKGILKTLDETSNSQQPSNNERITINCIGIEIKQKPVLEEDASSSADIKEEPISDTEDNGQQNIVTQPIGELDVAKEVVIKPEPEEVPDPSTDVKINVKAIKNDNDDKKDSSTNTSQPSTSHVARERCWYGAQCYRKNLQHKFQFSHPSDSDYGDVNEKPMCQFGSTCFRRNPRHYQQYEHPQPPGQAPKKTPSVKAHKQPRAPKAPKQDYESDAEGDYDYSDPFLDDGSSDEYQLSQSSDEDDDDEEINSQETEQEYTEENKLLLKEAKKFTKKK